MRRSARPGDAVLGFDPVLGRLRTSPSIRRRASSPASEALKNLVGELGDGGVALVVARMRSHLKGLLDEAGLVAEIGAEHFYPPVRAAVHACVSEESATGTHSAA